jgi:hypothetical protein
MNFSTAASQPSVSFDFSNPVHFNRVFAEEPKNRDMSADSQG